MDARTSRRQKRLSKQQEASIAHQVSGRTQANSGATRLGGGGDVRGNGLRIECKYTENQTYNLSYKDLEKVRKQAIKTLEWPVFLFGFRDARGSLETYCVIQWRTDVKEGKPFDIDTDSQRISLYKDFLRVALVSEGQRLRLTFRRNAVGWQYEVIRWADFLVFLKSQQENEHA